MRNSKKFLVLLLGMLIACAFALVACQPAVEPVQLVDFDDTTVTAELGKNYTLPSGTAFDTKDNVYRATYTVKTKSGGNVNVSSNQFFVANMEGYVITGTTETLADGTTKTRTITINVEDKGAPEIKMGSTGFGYVNSEYVIPEITVTDLSGESITPVVKVYKVVGDTETEVTVTDGKFTPTEKVTYRIKVSATDSSNNTATQSADVIVRGEKAPYVLEDFSDDHSLSIMTCPENGHSDVDDVWLEEFEGRSGVAYNPKTLNMYGPHFYFRLPEEIKNVEFEYVYARVYVKSAIGDLKPTFDACSWNHVIGTYPVNEWVEVRIDLADITSGNANFNGSLDSFVEAMTATNGAYLFWIPAFKDFTPVGGGANQKDSPSNYTVYFDEIGYKPSFTPVMELEEEYALGETVTLSATVNANIDESTYSFAYTVTDPSGNAVTLDNNSFRLLETGKYTVKVDFVHSEFVGTATYSFVAKGDKEITIDEFTDTVAMGDTVTVPVGTIDGALVTTTVELNGTTVEMDGNTFVAGVAGVYDVVYAAEIDGLIYKTVLKIEVAHELGKNEILGFNRAEDLEQFKFTTASHNIEWLPSFEGENGVIKISYGGDAWPWLTFKPAQKMATYQDATYLVVRAKALSGNNALLYMVLGNDATVQARPDGYQNSIGYDQWVDYVFDITPFLTFWSDGTFNEGPARLWFKSAGGNDGVLYISDISVMYNAAQSGITVDVSGDKRDGEEITVTMNVPSGVTGAQMTVKDPNGEVVTLTDNKFTAVKGVYTIEIICDGYPGVWTQTFTVTAAMEINANGEIVVNDNEVTLPTITVIDVATNSDVTADATIELTVTCRDNEVTVTDNKFTANKIGLYQIVWTITYNGKTVTKEEAVLIEFGYEVAPDEVLSFTLDEDINKVAINAPNATLKQITWLDQYEGEEGVAKFEWSGAQWPYIGFGANQDMSAYDDYDYLTITMYAPSTGNSLLYLKLGNNSGYDTWPVGYEYAIEYDKWQTYIFDITVFKQLWKSDLSEMNWNSTEKLWFKSNGMGAGEFYISDISVIKSASKSGIEIVTSGTLEEGNTISVSYNNPNEVADVTLIVKDPNGNVITDLTAFEAVGGKYTVEIYADGYFGIETLKVESKITYDSNVVLNFDQENQKERVLWYEGTTLSNDKVEWLDSYEGATGVAKFTHAHAWPWLMFNPIHEMSKYAKYDRITFCVFVPDDANAIQYMKLGNNTGSDQFPIGDGNTVVKGEWHDYVMDATYFVNNWNFTEQKNRLWFKAGSGESAIYVDSITMSSSTDFDTVVLSDYATLDATTAANYKGFAAGATYVDATAVAADNTLPAIPAGEDGYAKITATTNAWGVIEFRVSPTATYEQFAAADYIEFKYYAPGEGNRRVLVHNEPVTTATAGEWNIVRVPMTHFNAAGSLKFEGLEEWYTALVNNAASLVNLWELGNEVEATVYVTEIKLVSAPRNTALGDKYTEIKAENFKVNDGTATATTFDNKEVVKLTGGTWANVFIIPGKTIGELQAYDKIVITMYIESENKHEFYSQDTIYTESTVQRVHAYGPTDGTFYEYAPGEWFTLEIPVYHATQFFGRWQNSALATFINRGDAFTAIYISDITCVKNA